MQNNPSQSGKTLWKPGTMLYPLPAVLVSCGSESDNYNLITISWTGTICSNPPMCYISVRPERHSYGLIKESGEFVINLTTARMSNQTDWCGVKSGKEVNKFKETGLTPLPASVVKAPLIAESPVNIECRVKQIVPLGSHDMFIAEVLAVHANNDLIDPESGAFMLDRAQPLVYLHGGYYNLGKYLGKFGYSVAKHGKKKANYRK